MLQNEPLVAKIAVDTAENEPIFGWIQLVQLSVFNSSILSLVGTNTPGHHVAPVDRGAFKRVLFQLDQQTRGSGGASWSEFLSLRGSGAGGK